MQIASKNQDFEKAAIFRDRIKSLTYIQSSQEINKNNYANADVIASYREENVTCIVVFFYRSKQNWGSQAFFPQHDPSDKEADVLGAFLAQFYENKFEQFNTTDVVFYDNDTDFQCMETTISGMADGIYFFTLINKKYGK